MLRIALRSEEGHFIVGELISIAYKPQHIDFEVPDRFSRLAVDRVRLIANYGIEGDRKGGHHRRQINIMSYERLQEMNAEGCQTGPGQMGEQLVVSGIDVEALAPGDRIQLGSSACIEVIGLREPCERFEQVQNFPKERAIGRVGTMARVVTGGMICTGDEAEVVAKTAEVGHV